MQNLPFDCLDDHELKQLSPHGVTRRFSRAAVIVNEFDTTDSLYVVREGRVKVFVVDEEGREVVLSTIGVGDYFGELVLDGGPRAASVAALEATRCFIIPRGDVEVLVEGHPAFARDLIRRLIAKVRVLTTKVSDLAHKDVYGRLVKFLNDEAVTTGPVHRLTEPLTQQDIAARIGGSREMVNRILRDLCAGGYISIEARVITLHKPLPGRW